MKSFAEAHPELLSEWSPENIRESSKSIIVLDPEHEYEDLCTNLGGCYIDFTTGEYIINPLEPMAWSDGGDEIDKDI